MGELLSSLAVGILSNIVSNGIGTGIKRVLSKREIDLELRRSVENLQSRQLNLEGTIEQLVNNQNLLLSIFLELIQNYQLKSHVYIENKNIIIIPDQEDIDTLNRQKVDMHTADLEEQINEDKFDSYRKYVRKLVRLERKG